MKQPQAVNLQAQVPMEFAGKRIDQFLSRNYPQYSRAQFQTWIKAGNVEIDQKICKKANTLLQEGQEIIITAFLEDTNHWDAQPIPINITFEDDDFLVINKEAGMVVHPGSGNSDNTLANALLHYFPSLMKIPRAGVVHRLDKDTSGLMLIAKTPAAYQNLIDAMKNRAIKREYLALVKGHVISGGSVDAPIGRHLTHRTKMAVVPDGRAAVTHYRIAEKFTAHTLLTVQLETGRTHQIRVHFNHIHFPLVGDPLYRTAVALPAKLTETQQIAIRAFNRQALHAFRLSLSHPITNQPLTFEAPMPEDMQALLAILRKSE